MNPADVMRLPVGMLDEMHRTIVAENRARRRQQAQARAKARGRKR